MKVFFDQNPCLYKAGIHNISTMFYWYDAFLFFKFIFFFSLQLGSISLLPLWKHATWRASYLEGVRLPYRAVDWGVRGAWRKFLFHGTTHCTVWKIIGEMALIICQPFRELFKLSLSFTSFLIVNLLILQNTFWSYKILVSLSTIF